MQFPDNTTLSTADPNKLGIPIGGIIMWSGTSASVPSNWAICDGTNGTPDLQNRFVVGVGSSYAVGNTGGSASVTLTTAQLPAHNHTGNTSTNGNHTHGSNSTDRLGFAARVFNSTVTSLDNTGDEISQYITTRLQISEAGDHSHSFTTNFTGSDQAHENRPPYYALYYIMKISN
ncbi:MAG: hypothetical protein HY960_05130 [Ignavibacteriae bacterium]|nr:hypothetical protein [Ignavibacteriota bacterium]